MLMTTILAFTLRVLGGPLLSKRKIIVDKPAKDIKAGEAFEIVVKS